MNNIQYPTITVAQFNESSFYGLPQHLGMQVVLSEAGRLIVELPIVQHLMAPNGYLHAGSIVSLADTSTGCGCMANLPEGASNFTTVELKSNHLSTAREGTLRAEATLVHAGRTTQVWDSIVTQIETGKKIALFRCTQIILYPKMA